MKTAFYIFLMLVSWMGFGALLLIGHYKYLPDRWYTALFAWLFGIAWLIFFRYLIQVLSDRNSK